MPNSCLSTRGPRPFPPIHQSRTPHMVSLHGTGTPPGERPTAGLPYLQGWATLVRSREPCGYINHSRSIITLNVSFILTSTVYWNSFSCLGEIHNWKAHPIHVAAKLRLPKDRATGSAPWRGPFLWLLLPRLCFPLGLSLWNETGICPWPSPSLDTEWVAGEEGA